MLPPCLDRGKQRNSFTRTNCHRGLEIFCLSGPARQRFDLTFKNSSRTFHEVHVNFYGFLPPSFEMIIILLQQERGLILTSEEATSYRSGLGKLMYLAIDHLDLNYAVNTLARKASKPSKLDVLKLHRVVRYLRGHQTVDWTFLTARSVSLGMTATRRSMMLK